MRFTIHLVIISIFVATGALAQYHESEYGIPELAIRPLDDSDPEMHALMESIQARGPCNRGPGKVCEEAVDQFRRGGERLAAYLIRQHQLSVDGRYLSSNRYLRQVASTQTEGGFQYIRSLVERGPQPAPMNHFYKGTIDALALCRDPRAVDVAIQIYPKLREAKLRVVAITAVEYNLSADRPRPDAIEWIKELEKSERDEDWPTRLRAYSALNNLEDAGLSTPRVVPESILTRVPARP